MQTKFCSCRSLLLIAFVVCSVVAAQDVAWAAPKALDAVAAKQMIEARGIGKGIKVTETDGSVVQGLITGAGDSSFQVKIDALPQPIDIPYAKVAALKNRGSSTGVRVGKTIGLGLLAGVAAFAIILVVLVAVVAHS